MAPSRPSASQSLWLSPRARPERIALHPRFDAYPYFHESYEQYVDSPSRTALTDVEVRWVPLRSVRQPIVADDEEDAEREEAFIADVARRMKRGEDVPPALMQGGELFDGRHRILAAEALGLRKVPVVDLSAARRPNPMLSLTQWRQPVLYYAEHLEAEIGPIPPAAILFAAMQGPVTVPVLGRIPEKRSRVHAGIEIEAFVERPGGPEPAWGSDEVAMLLTHHQPDLSASPSGRKWSSWVEAAPALLSLILERGTQASDRTEVGDPTILYIDNHGPQPPHGAIEFFSWTVPLEKKRRHNPIACGDCFGFASEEALRRGATVVHGTVVDPPTGRRAAHAWAELHGQAYDYQGHRMPVARYYATFQPADVERYTPTEALVLGLRTGHHGPWTVEERGPGIHARRPMPPRLGPPPAARALPAAPGRPRRATRRALERQAYDARRTGDIDHARELEREIAAMPRRR